MLQYTFLLVTLISVFAQGVLSNYQCDSKSFRLSLTSTKNQTGMWEDRFTARAEYETSSKGMVYDVIHTVTECNGKRTVTITGGTGNSSTGDIIFDRLTFHPRCGKNIAILNNGRTVQKINMEDPVNSVVFTSRPLKDNEIFEIRLDQRLRKHASSMGIGIITSSPEYVQILPEMWKSPDAWIWHHTAVHNNGKQTLSNYPKKNLNDVQVGERVGVMRNEYGTLHFYINGIDQGPAASGMPAPVYGLFELWFDATRATIVNPP